MKKTRFEQRHNQFCFSCLKFLSISQIFFHQVVNLKAFNLWNTIVINDPANNITSTSRITTSVKDNNCTTGLWIALHKKDFNFLFIYNSVIFQSAMEEKNPKAFPPLCECVWAFTGVSRCITVRITIFCVADEDLAADPRSLLALVTNQSCWCLGWFQSFVFDFSLNKLHLVSNFLPPDGDLDGKVF